MFSRRENNVNGLTQGAKIVHLKRKKHSYPGNFMAVNIKVLFYQGTIIHKLRWD